MPGLFGLGCPHHQIHGLDGVDVLSAHPIVVVVEDMLAHDLKQVLGGYILEHVSTLAVGSDTLKSRSISTAIPAKIGDTFDRPVHTSGLA